MADIRRAKRFRRRWKHTGRVETHSFSFFAESGWNARARRAAQPERWE
jgi:hypothetical protein